MLRRLPTLLALLSLAGGTTACTSYILGSRASEDGSILVARNDDGEGAVSPSSLVYHPARQGPAVFHANENRLALELPGPGLAYLSVPAGPLADAASGRNTSGEAAGFNAAGVAISATESIYNSAAALSADPHNTDSGIIEDAIPSILLPQMTSARHGAALLGRLVSEHGAGEAFGVLLADAREAWYLETASGHHWLAQRVPDDAFFVSANQGRFQEVDLEDESRAIASPGLRQFAIDAHLYDPSSGRPFNFFEAFMRDGAHDTNYSYPRVCLLQHLFGGCSPLTCNAPVAPTFLPAHPRKLTPQDIMAAMRNHWDGTPHDPYLHANPEEPWRPIALLRTGMGHVTVMRPPSQGLPDGLSVVAYVALATPKLSPFIPIYKGLPGDALPRELTAGTKRRQPDMVSLFWRARRLQALVFQDYAALAPTTADRILDWERRLELGRPAFEARYAKATASDPAAADKVMATWTQGVAASAGALLDDLAEWAAEALGMPSLPSQERWLALLDEAAEAYAFEPTSDDPAPALARPGQPRSGGGATAMQ